MGTITLRGSGDYLDHQDICVSCYKVHEICCRSKQKYKDQQKNLILICTSDGFAVARSVLIECELYKRECDNSN